MSDRTRWLVLVLGFGMLFAVILQIPSMMDRHALGTRVHLPAETALTIARVREPLTGHLEQASEPLLGDSAVRGLRPVFFETAYGAALRGTGIEPQTILRVASSLIAFLLFVALWMFFRLAGFHRVPALVGALLFMIVQWQTTMRDPLLSAQTLLTLAAMAGLLMGLRHHSTFGLVGGFLLGTLIGTMPGAAVFAWAWWSILLMWLVGEWAYVRAHRSWALRFHRMFKAVLVPLWRLVRRQEQPFLPVRWHRMLLFGGVALLAAWPHVVEQVLIAQAPYYTDAIGRSTAVQESPWIMGLLFGVMVVCIGMALRTRIHVLIAHQATVVTIATALLLLVLGLSDASVYPLFAIAAICAVLLGATIRDAYFGITAFAGCAVLILGAWGGWNMAQRDTMASMIPAYEEMFSALPALDALPHSRILGDPATQLLVAAFTEHDVVYGTSLRDALLPNLELAERFCLSWLPAMPEERLVAIREEFLVAEQRRVANTCGQVERFPRAYLIKFGVTHVLVDERSHPDWNLDRLGAARAEAARGEGWSLWKIVEGT